MHRKKPMGKQSNRAWRSVAIVLACVCTFYLACRAFLSKSSGFDGTSSSDGKTLVVHIFADTDPEYLENLKFFVEWGIPDRDQADYVIVVQSTEASVVGWPPVPFCVSRANFKAVSMTCRGHITRCVTPAACQATSNPSKCKVRAT